MKWNIHIRIIVLAGWMALVACQNEPTRKPDPLNKGYQYIDRGDYDTAISELTQLSHIDARPEVQVALASAYAARGGIKVAQYWGFVVGFKSPLLKADDVPVSPTLQSLKNISDQADGKVSPADLEALSKIARALALWELYKDRINAIPVVEGTANQDVISAVDILSRIQTPGGRLYRAILNLILFKSSMNTSPEPFENFALVVQKTAEGDQQALCDYNASKLMKWFEPLTYRLSETLFDLTIAFPEQSTEIAAAQAQLFQVDENIQKARQQLRKKRVCQ